MQSDTELLRQWRAGDKAAGNRLFQRHFHSVLRFFRNKVDGEPEELLQRTFMACVEARDRFREEASFRTFLFAIAHNVLRVHLRGLVRDRQNVDVDDTSIVDLGASPTTVLGARREEQLLLLALRRIPSASQTILELYYWERFTGAELGRFLGVPEDTARSRLRKAKEQLEAALSQLAAAPHELRSTVSGLDEWAANLRGQLASMDGPAR